MEVKVFLSWLPLKRYECSCCDNKRYVMGKINPLGIIAELVDALQIWPKKRIFVRQDNQL